MSTKYYVDAEGRYLGAFESLTVGETVFEPTVPQGAIEVAGPPEHGLHIWNGSAWAPPAPSEAALCAHASAKRRSLETGTAVVNTGLRAIPVWVDPESCAKVTGLVVALLSNPALTVKWKGSDGAFYDLASAEIVPLAMGMMAFIQTCFEAEATVIAAIDGGTITTLQQIDDADWPTAA